MRSGKAIYCRRPFGLQGIFPKTYVTSVMAGEKSGSLGETLERFIAYQKLSLAVRKKVLVSLMYPCVLIVLVILLMVFLVTYVVPSFAELYTSMNAKLPGVTLFLITIGTTARAYVLLGAGVLAAFGVFLFYWSKTETGQEKLDAVRMRTPVLGNIWIKYQVAQFARVLSTLLTGGIPLVQGLETAADSLGTALLRKVAREGRTAGARRPTAFRFARHDQRLSTARDRHDRGGRIDRRATRDADKRGRVLRGRRQHPNDCGALTD